MPTCDLCKVEYKEGEEHKCTTSEQKAEGATQTNPQQA